MRTLRFVPVVVLGFVGCGPGVRPNPAPSAPDATAEPPDGTMAVNCKVVDDDNAMGECTDTAPPNSFEPEVQWMWTGPADEPYSIVTPLVANLTDDNGDGSIDLCDVPDIVVVTGGRDLGFFQSPGHIWFLDGGTGGVKLEISTVVDATVTPALGDLDHDGVPEIVTVNPEGMLYAFDHTGATLWGPRDLWWGGSPGGIPAWYSGAIALADLDHDGHVEIVAGNAVYNDQGYELWHANTAQAVWNSTSVADLDGDGFQEVVLGAAAYHHDGTLYWSTDLAAGYPQVANLDDDPEPEVLLTNKNGISLIDHDGHIQYRDRRPTGGAVSPTGWIRPATIHDFNGDGRAEFAMSSGGADPESSSFYTEYNADATMRWNAVVSDLSGIAAGTAFDFLGDGTAEAMYADEDHLFVFDDAGHPLLRMPRASGTLTEYPVVADVDNDGSAEIVVVSNLHGTMDSPTVQVIRDRQDRWIQARRIWNQHTYHVTNVREDGTIPQNERPSWQRLNTFRTNAQIDRSGVCRPVIL